MSIQLELEAVKHDRSCYTRVRDRQLVPALFFSAKTHRPAPSCSLHRHPSRWPRRHRPPRRSTLPSSSLNRRACSSTLPLPQALPKWMSPVARSAVSCRLASLLLNPPPPAVRSPPKAPETIHNFLEGKSTYTYHNVIVPGDHAITLSNSSRYHKSCILNTCLRRVQ